MSDLDWSTKHPMWKGEEYTPHVEFSNSLGTGVRIEKNAFGFFGYRCVAYNTGRRIRVKGVDRWISQFTVLKYKLTLSGALAFKDYYIEKYMSDYIE